MAEAYTPARLDCEGLTGDGRVTSRVAIGRLIRIARHRCRLGSLPRAQRQLCGRRESACSHEQCCDQTGKAICSQHHCDNVRPIGLLDILDQLDDGAVELALSTLVEGGDRFKCVGLLEDEYVVIFSSDHPDATVPRLSIERFSALPHISITANGNDAQFVDEALAARGLARRVHMKVALHSLVSVLIGSQAIAVVPRRIAAYLAIHCPLATQALPFPSPHVRLSMIWHRRVDRHPAHR